MCTVVQIWKLSASGQRLKTRKSLEITGWSTYQMDEAPGSAREPVSKNMVGCKQERHPILISASICTCLKIWTHTLTHVEHTRARTHTHIHTHNSVTVSPTHTYVVSHCLVASVVSDERSAVNLTKLAHRMDSLCLLPSQALPFALSMLWECCVWVRFPCTYPHWSLSKYLNV